jgi:transketolase C-terminal domain/subunit
MYVELSSHANRRIKDHRQCGVSERDVIGAAKSIPGHIPYSMKFRNFIGADKALFDLVLLDKSRSRLVVSVIGKH